jgi:hypothetical protein
MRPLRERQRGTTPAQRHGHHQAGLFVGDALHAGRQHDRRVAQETTRLLTGVGRPKLDRQVLGSGAAFAHRGAELGRLSVGQAQQQRGQGQIKPPRSVRPISLISDGDEP